LTRHIVTMRFRITGLDADAGPATLTVDAADAPAARRAAARAGVAALEITLLGAPAAALHGPARAGSFLLDLFCQELRAMLSAGIPLREALETLAAKEQQGGGAVVAQLLARLREGQPLSAAMAAQPAVFPVLLAQSMRAAERTSDYDSALDRFVRYRRMTGELRARLIGAAVYPLLLLGVSLAVLLFLLGYVVPRFAQVYADMGERLPLASRVLLEVGLALAANPAAAAAAALLVLGLAVRAWRSGRLASLLLAALGWWPAVRETLHAVQRARLYRTLALLLAGGLPVVPALALARGVLAGELAPRIDQARESIRQGRPFADSLAAAGLSDVVAERFMRVGERTGRLAEMIDRAADFHEEHIARRVDRLARLIGPLMMLAMGVLIGLVVVLMYLPIFQLAEALQ
jgi:general secretion pathway protein F